MKIFKGKEQMDILPCNLAWYQELGWKIRPPKQNAVKKIRAKRKAR